MTVSQDTIDCSDLKALSPSGTGRGPTPGGGVDAAVGHERRARGDRDEAAPTELKLGTGALARASGAASAAAAILSKDWCSSSDTESTKSAAKEEPREVFFLN